MAPKAVALTIISFAIGITIPPADDGGWVPGRRGVDFRIVYGHSHLSVDVPKSNSLMIGEGIGGRIIPKRPEISRKITNVKCREIGLGMAERKVD